MAKQIKTQRTMIQVSAEKEAILLQIESETIILQIMRWLIERGEAILKVNPRDYPEGNHFALQTMKYESASIWRFAMKDLKAAKPGCFGICHRHAVDLCDRDTDLVCFVATIHACQRQAKSIGECGNTFDQYAEVRGLQIRTYVLNPQSLIDTGTGGQANDILFISLGPTLLIGVIDGIFFFRIRNFKQSLSIAKLEETAMA